MSNKYTIKEFIEKSSLIHKNKYNYTESVYLGSLEDTYIICPIHGGFWQEAHTHMRGFGCSACSGKERITTEEFIFRSRKVHGDKYDYSKSIYTNWKTKIIILCSIHGEFTQQPTVHFNGGNCGKCFGNKKLTTEEFIDRAVQIHGIKYNYSEVVYKNFKTDIKIKCLKHGYFFKTPKMHLEAGAGCIDCYEENKITTTEKFIKKAIAVHGDKYNYSKSVYKNIIKPKVIIICKKHGDFTQRVDGHIAGDGCPQCGKDLISEKLSDTLESFIKKANLIHGNLYSYEDVEYTGSRNHIDINCKKHGSFLQIARSHLQGHGCPKCHSIVSKSEINWLNYMHVDNEYRHKTIKANNRNYYLDAFDIETNTIYEFYGDYWHGNPKIFDSYDFNDIMKKTYGCLYQNTINRENELRALGYNLVVMWENDWKKIEKSMK